MLDRKWWNEGLRLLITETKAKYTKRRKHRAESPRHRMGPNWTSNKVVWVGIMCSPLIPVFCRHIHPCRELCVKLNVPGWNLNVWEKSSHIMSYIDTFPYLPTSYELIRVTEMCCSRRDHTWWPFWGHDFVVKCIISGSLHPGVPWANHFTSLCLFLLYF